MTGPLKTIEPVTTLFDDQKFLRIITELPASLKKKSGSILRIPPTRL
jgi:hypothetical protein